MPILYMHFRRIKCYLCPFFLEIKIRYPVTQWNFNKKIPLEGYVVAILNKDYLFVIWLIYKILARNG